MTNDTLTTSPHNVPHAASPPAASTCITPSPSRLPPHATHGHSQANPPPPSHRIPPSPRGCTEPGPTTSASRPTSAVSAAAAGLTLSAPAPTAASPLQPQQQPRRRTSQHLHRGQSADRAAPQLAARQLHRWAAAVVAHALAIDGDDDRADACWASQSTDAWAAQPHPGTCGSGGRGRPACQPC